MKIAGLGLTQGIAVCISPVEDSASICDDAVQPETR